MTMSIPFLCYQPQIEGNQILDKVRLDIAVERIKNACPLSSRAELTRICRTENRYALDAIKRHEKRLKKSIPDSERLETRLNLEILLKYVKEMEALEGVFSYVYPTR